MRITQNVMVDNMMNNLQKNMEQMDKFSQRLSSGKQFQHPSEAPIEAAKSMNFTSMIEKSEQFEENVNQARSWLETSESAMDDANEVVQRARELTIQGANDTLTESERENLAQEMEELRNELISIAETRHGDRYVFSGQSTDQAPFDEQGNYQGDHKNIVREINPGVDMTINVTGEEAFGESIDALDDVISDLRQGNPRVYTEELEGQPLSDVDGIDVEDEELTFTLEGPGGEEIEIDGIDLEENMTRREIVDEINETIWDSDQDGIEDNYRYARLRGNRIEFRHHESGGEYGVRVESEDEDLMNALFVDEEVAEENGDFFVSEQGGEGSIQLGTGDIESFNDAIDSSLQTRAEIGARVNRLDLTERRLEDEIINLRQLRSENEDTDMAETITEMRMQESVYQASLATGARIIQPSLVDFLQ